MDGYVVGENKCVIGERVLHTSAVFQQKNALRRDRRDEPHNLAVIDGASRSRQWEEDMRIKGVLYDEIFERTLP